MTIDDYDGAVRLWKDVSGVAMRALDDSRGGIAKFLERNPRSCFVAVPAGAADTVLGVILCGHDGRRAYIYHTTVGEECRGKGIGRSLTKLRIIREKHVTLAAKSGIISGRITG
jgi:ribosomal protein S18 acetylase RimI-like enzyme